MDQRKVFEFIGLIKELEQIQFERDSLDQMFFAKWRRQSLIGPLLSRLSNFTKYKNSKSKFELRSSEESSVNCNRFAVKFPNRDFSRESLFRLPKISQWEIL